MPTVSIGLNGRNYDIACGEGEEPRVLALAHELRRRVESLSREAGPVSESMLLVMAGLLLADALDTERRAVEAERAERGRARQAEEDRLAEMVERLAARIEAIAARLEAA